VKIIVLHHSSVFLCAPQVLNIYDNRRKLLVIGPFDYSTMDEIDLLCRLPDPIIREVCLPLVYFSLLSLFFTLVWLLVFLLFFTPVTFLHFSLTARFLTIFHSCHFFSCNISNFKDDNKHLSYLGHFFCQHSHLHSKIVNFIIKGHWYAVIVWLLLKLLIIVVNQSLLLFPQLSWSIYWLYYLGNDACTVPFCPVINFTIIPL